MSERRGRSIVEAAPIFGVALVTFVLFKVLSLFVAPANLVLCLLVVGHPIGVLVGARFYEGRVDRALRHFFVVVCATLLALTLLRAVTPALVPPWISGGYPLGDVTRLLVVCAVTLMPLFVGSGAVEYLVLQRVRARTGSTGRAYATLLGGTLAGLLVGFALLPWIGALGLVALAVAVLAATTLERRGAAAILVVVGVAAAGLSSVFPGADAALVVAISPGGPYTARGAVDGGARLVRASWDRQSYTQVLATDRETFGAYDNLVYWDVRRTIERKAGSKDDLVFDVLPEGSRVAIVGVGGGRQLHQALALDRRLAFDVFEINDTIVRHYLQHPDDNGRAFIAPGVRAFGMDGRRGVLEHGPYDAIYLPEAGTVLGYYRTLAIDLNFLHTADAYRGYAQHLAEGGLLVSAFASYADPDNYVSRRVARSFRDMGLVVHAYASKDWAVVLGALPGGESKLEAADEIARGLGVPTLEEGSADTSLPSDDLGLNLILALTPRAALSRAFAAAAAVVLALGAAAMLVLARRARRRIVGASIRPLVLSIGLGASFLLVENAVILNLARRIWNMADAVILGSGAFLVCAVVGAFARHALRDRPALAAWGALGVLGAGAVLVVAAPKDSGAVLVGALALAVATGTLFPRLIDAGGPALLPYLYACDGVGALLGTVVVFFVPLLFGIGVLSVVAAIACAVVGVFVVLPLRSR